MAIVLYCVAPEAAGETFTTGIAGRPVRWRAHNGLRFFFSEATQEQVAHADVATAAREVMRVTDDVFARGPVLPFRFPTVLGSEGELQKLAHEQGSRFAEFLEWVGPRVQMDVRLTLGEERTKGPSTPAAKTGPPPLGMTREPPPLGMTEVSGTEYLRARAQDRAWLVEAAEKSRQQGGCAEWRIEERSKFLLCHLLMDRVQVISFQERMSHVELPERVNVVVSGPWPPAAFWEDRSR